jgi:hypothetical protein
VFEGRENGPCNCRYTFQTSFSLVDVAMKFHLPTEESRVTKTVNCASKVASASGYESGNDAV